jgi:hypothetical protein
MDKNIQRLIPRFRYGVINPRAPGKLQRGFSYQFYRIVPSDVMEITTGLGLDDYAPHAVEKAISNYWDCVHALMEEKVNVIVSGRCADFGTVGTAATSRASRRDQTKNQH